MRGARAAAAAALTIGIGTAPGAHGDGEQWTELPRTGAAQWEPAIEPEAMQHPPPPKIEMEGMTAGPERGRGTETRWTVLPREGAWKARGEAVPAIVWEQAGEPPAKLVSEAQDAEAPKMAPPSMEGPPALVAEHVEEPSEALVNEEAQRWPERIAAEVAPPLDEPAEPPSRTTEEMAAAEREAPRTERKTPVEDRQEPAPAAGIEPTPPIGEHTEMPSEATDATATANVATTRRKTVIEWKAPAEETQQGIGAIKATPPATQAENPDTAPKEQTVVQASGEAAEADAPQVAKIEWDAPEPERGRPVWDPPTTMRIWQVHAGSTLRTTLHTWCVARGWKLQWEADRDWPLQAGGEISEEEFKHAVRELLEGIHATPGPVASLYPANRQLVVRQSTERG